MGSFRQATCPSALNSTYYSPVSDWNFNGSQVSRQQKKGRGFTRVFRPKMFIGWRKLMHAKNADLYEVIEFRQTAAYGLIFLAPRMFEYGEAHFQSLLVYLKDTWGDLAAVTSDILFPFDFSETDIERIKLDSYRAVVGTELVAVAKERMGDLWPDKGFIEHDRYDDCKAALQEVKDQILEHLAETGEERAEYEDYRPFD